MPDTSARLHRIASALREAGERDIRLEMTRTLRAEAQPLKDAVQQAALAKLPKSGGLAAREAASVQVQVLTSARGAGVYLRNRRLGAAQSDKGYVRHPVFGDMNDWAQEQIPQASGWWTKTLSRKSSEVAAALTATIGRIAARIGSL